MNSAPSFVLAIGLLVLAYLVRAVPGWLSPRGLGTDHWYWKTYIDEYRRTKRFPPDLPQYVLEDAQWYPPLFPLVMARLPPAMFDRWSSQIAIYVDLLRMVLLLSIAFWQTGGDWTVVLVAGLVYATTPIQISYNVQLNPRGLAAIMLDIALIAILWVYEGGSSVLWVVVVAMVGLLPLTHKMTTQLFWFLVLGTAVIYRWWELLALIPVSMVAAMVISRGFYAKVLRHHWDIVTFWNRNWPWIGADPVRESPIYGDGRYERANKLHKAGLRGVLWHGYILFGFNPAAWVACLLVYERLFVQSPLLIYPTPILVWLLLMCAFACLTAFVPRLKCLGAGYLYVYNTAVPASLILALTYQYTRAPVLSAAYVAVAVGLNVIGLVIYYRQSVTSKLARVDAGFDEILEHLGRKPKGVVMCLPANWYEVVTYKTKQPVLWGAHGYGFRRLEPTWPRLLLPIREILSRYHVRYLLTMDEMLPEGVVAELPAASVIVCREYKLYSFAMPEANDDQTRDDRVALTSGAPA